MHGDTPVPRYIADDRIGVFRFAALREGDEKIRRTSDAYFARALHCVGACSRPLFVPSRFNFAGSLNVRTLCRFRFRFVGKGRIVCGEPRMDLLPRFCGFYRRELRSRRVRLRICEDFDDLCILQRFDERNNFSVRFCADDFFTDSGVNAVCEVDRVRAGRKLYDLSLRRKHVNFITEQIVFQRAEKIFVGNVTVSQFTQFIENAEVFDVDEVATLSFFVQPVTCDTVLGRFVHRFCAYLYFKRLSVAHDGRMQRAVTVCFRHSDIIFKSPV